MFLISAGLFLAWLTVFLRAFCFTDTGRGALARWIRSFVMASGMLLVSFDLSRELLDTTRILTERYTRDIQGCGSETALGHVLTS